LIEAQARNFVPCGIFAETLLSSFGLGDGEEVRPFQRANEGFGGRCVSTLTKILMDDLPTKNGLLRPARAGVKSSQPTLRKPQCHTLNLRRRRRSGPAGYNTPQPVAEGKRSSRTLEI
jgi:hypothetical protein